MNLDPAHFFLFFVVASFLWVAGDAMLVRLSRFISSRVAHRKWRDCHLCGKRYGEKPGLKLSSCPDCEALNHKRGHRKLG
ncbi:MAG: hypothetical protein ACON5H_03750 [Akkermansiaceae bacterium]